jgi:hypothetical protein
VELDINKTTILLTGGNPFGNNIEIRTLGPECLYLKLILTLIIIFFS